MATLVRQERFVNNLGRAYTNIPIDLDVEHSNKFFKEDFHLSLREPAQRVLDRLSKSQDTVAQVLRTFRCSFKLEYHDARHTVDEKKYFEDVNKVAAQLTSANAHEFIGGRALKSMQLCVTSKDIIANFDMYKFRYWLVDRMAAMMNQPFYKY